MTTPARYSDDVGFTIPAQGVTCWNGEAMHGTGFKDLDQTRKGPRRPPRRPRPTPPTWPGCSAMTAIRQSGNLLRQERNPV